MITTIHINCIILLFCINIAVANSQVVINEIMPIPLSGEPEWIELYNYGAEDIELLNYTINDATNAKNIPYFILKSDSYAILVKDTNLLKTFRNIPESATLIQMIVPTLNNTFDYLVLKNNVSETLDSIYYDMKWGEKYFSIERIDASKPAISPENWLKCANSLGATPGAANSVIKQKYDIACTELYISEDFNNILTTIEDIGASKTHQFDFSLYIDFNNDEVFDVDEKIIDIPVSNFDKMDTIISVPIEMAFDKITKNGMYQFVAVVNATIDENPINDTIFASIYLQKEEPKLRINEFMYDITSDRAEFIEIWNAGSDTVTMDNFLIWDAAGSREKGNVKINSADFKIAPNSYGVVCWDSIFYDSYPELLDNPNVYCKKSSLNLNLAGDLIVLADANGKIYDSLTYANNWHTKSIIETKNKSLEKLNENLISSDKNSWATCSDVRGATPLEKNSISMSPSKDIELEISPNPFAPSSLGDDAITKISINLPFAMSYISASVYDLTGFKVAELANNRYTSGIAYLEWDGTNLHKYNLQIGQYILLIEATDVDTGNVAVKKSIIVIGG